MITLQIYLFQFNPVPPKSARTGALSSMPQRTFKIQDAVLTRIISNLKNPNINWTPLSEKFSKFLNSPSPKHLPETQDSFTSSPTKLNDSSKGKNQEYGYNSVDLSVPTPMSVSSFYAESPGKTPQVPKKSVKDIKNTNKSKSVHFAPDEYTDSDEKKDDVKSEDYEESSESYSSDDISISDELSFLDENSDDNNLYGRKDLEVSSDSESQEIIENNKNKNKTKNVRNTKVNDKYETPRTTLEFEISSDDTSVETVNEIDSKTPSISSETQPDTSDSVEAVSTKATPKTSLKDNKISTIKGKTKKKSKTHKKSIKRSSSSKTKTMLKTPVLNTTITNPDFIESDYNDNNEEEEEEKEKSNIKTVKNIKKKKRRNVKTPKRTKSTLKSQCKETKNKTKTPLRKSQSSNDICLSSCSNKIETKKVKSNNTTVNDSKINISDLDIPTKAERKIERGCESVYDLSEESIGDIDEEFCFERNFLSTSNIKPTITPGQLTHDIEISSDESQTYEEEIKQHISKNDTDIFPKSLSSTESITEDESYSISDIYSSYSNSDKNNEKNKKSYITVDNSIISNKYTKDKLLKSEISRKNKEEKYPINPKCANNKSVKNLPVSPENYNYKKFSKERQRISQEVYDAMKCLVFGDNIPEIGETRYIKNCGPGMIETKTSIVWNSNLKKAAGRCVSSISRINQPYSLPENGEQVLYKAEFVIELSTKYLDCYKRLLQTLGHEMCHLAVFINMPEQLTHKSKHHGTPFKRWAMQIEKKTGVPIHIKHDYKMFYTHRWICDECGYVYGRFSMSINPEKQHCGRCGGHLSFLGVYEGNSECEHLKNQRGTSRAEHNRE